MTQDSHVLSDAQAQESVQLQDIADQVIDGSNVSWLTQADGQRFLALYRADQTGDRTGGVMLLHDQGQHLNWPGLLQHLRIELPNQGWSTLSVAMPPPIETSADISQQRLSSALTFWQQIEKDQNLVMILFGLSGQAWFQALEANLSDTGIIGYILIDAYQTLPANEFNLSAALFKQTQPIFDWISMQEYALTQGEQRRIKAKQNNSPNYHSYPLPKARPYAEHDLTFVRKRSLQWLNQLVDKDS